MPLGQMFRLHDIVSSPCVHLFTLDRRVRFQCLSSDESFYLDIYNYLDIHKQQFSRELSKHETFGYADIKHQSCQKGVKYSAINT